MKKPEVENLVALSLSKLALKMCFSLLKIVLKCLVWQIFSYGRNIRIFRLLIFNFGPLKKNFSDIDNYLNSLEAVDIPFDTHNVFKQIIIGGYLTVPSSLWNPSNITYLTS
jgi:hypothetical protein